MNATIDGAAFFQPGAVKSPPYHSKYLDTRSLPPSIRTFFGSERNDRALSSSCSSIRSPS